MSDDASPPANQNQPPTVDVAPLLAHIAALEDQVKQLTEASTRWEIRAVQAEAQLSDLVDAEPDLAKDQPVTLATRQATFAEIPENPNGLET